MTQARIDPERCQGHARCWELCPEVFAIDDEGVAYVAAPDVPPALEASARLAAANCPEGAITVE